MILYQAQSEVSSMLFFKMRKVRQDKEARTEALLDDNIKKIEEAKANIKQLGDEITFQIFEATRRKGTK